MKNQLIAWSIVLFIAAASGLAAQKGKGGKGGGGSSPPADPTIAFAGQGMADELSVINADGSNKRVIFTSNQWIGAPSWNPGGGTVAFTHGDYQIMLVDVAVVNGTAVGVNPRVLIDSSSLGFGFDLSSAEWSPLGNEIAVTAYAASRKYLLAVDVQTAAVSTIYAAPVGKRIWSPTWRSDGSQIAVVFDDIPSNRNQSVIIVNRSNGAVVNVLSPGLDIAGRRPLRWARTSDTLALCARLPNTFGASLHTMSIANPTPVLIVLEKAWEPAWSPDDARILFTEAVGSSKLKTVEVATGSTRTLANQTGPGDWRR